MHIDWWTGRSRLVLGALAVWLSATPLSGQDEARADSLIDAARQAQIEFESFRESRIPPQVQGGGGSCDEMVGRLCLRHGSDESPLGEEPIEITVGRTELTGILAAAYRARADEWVLGQMVFYLGEQGEWDRANRLVENCDIGKPWLCSAMQGLIMQRVGRVSQAEELFTSALAQMPDDMAQWFRSADLLLDEEGREALSKRGDEESRAAFHREFWLLADPLYLEEGNDRLTEHFARKTVVLIRRDAANPFGLEWEGDLEELTTRYGPEQGWERGRGALPGSAGIAGDDRYVIGRHHPKTAQYVAPGRFLSEPTAIPADEWTVEQRKPRAGYAPTYAPDIDPLHTQVARFRRGDSILVVAAWTPGADEQPARAERPARGRRARDARERSASPFGNDPFRAAPSEDASGDVGADTPAALARNGDTSVRTGFFVLKPDGEPELELLGSAAVGALTATVPNGRYILGLEVLSPGLDYAWRARQGLTQEDVRPDLAVASDLLILDGDPELPESIEDAAPRALPGVRLRSGDRITVAWEVYNLRPGDRAQVTVGVTQGRPNLLRRFGEFLRVIEPEVPLVVSFEDAGPDELGTVFRTVGLELPELEPGEYTLHVEVALVGRAPMVLSRRVTVLG